MSDPVYPSDKQDKFVLRLPEGMRDRIKAAADVNSRSMNAEIIATLEEKYPSAFVPHSLLEAALADRIKEIGMEVLPAPRAAPYDMIASGEAFRAAIEVKTSAALVSPEYMAKLSAALTSDGLDTGLVFGMGEFSKTSKLAAEQHGITLFNLTADNEFVEHIKAALSKAKE